MSSFEQIYADAPAEQRERLQQFRQNHPIQKTSVNGVEWEYLTGGEGDEVVLLLVGGLRVADAGFRAMLELERDFCVITPTYARVETMAELCDGLAGILAYEGVPQAHVLAGSFGG